MYALLLWGVAILYPSINYLFYYIIVFSILIFLAMRKTPNHKEWIAFISLCSIIFIAALPKVFSYLSISDINELAKCVMFFTIVFIAKTRIQLSQIKSIIIFVLFVDLSFSILQWIHFENPLFERINNIIHPNHHIEGSLLLASVRALGIFTDVAEHAGVIFIFYAFFLSLLRFQHWPYQSAFSAFLCALILVITQSKTGLIALVASVPLAVYCASRSFSKIKIALLAVLLLSLTLIYIPKDIIESFEQIYYLVEYGFGLSSFDERQLIWSRVVSASLDAPPLLMLFGAGRGHLEAAGFQSSVFDNDFVYLLNSYGLFGLSIFIVVYFLALSKLFKIDSPESSWLFYALLFMPLIGFATDFISSLKVLVLIALITASSPLISLSNREIKRSRHNKLFKGRSAKVSSMTAWPAKVES
jgi:hypothetical protein